MAKFKFLFPLFLCAFVLPVHTQMKPPFPKTYPEDIGDVQHINHYFQYSSASMAWTKIYLATHPYTKFVASSVHSQVDLTSILYRTHAKKGVLFHFQPGSLDQLPALMDILYSVDRYHNIYKLPVFGASTVNYTEFLTMANFTAKVALGFHDEDRKSDEKNPKLAGYSQDDIDGLAKITSPLCKPINTRHYIALNAYLVGAANKGVTIDYYKKFRRCRLLLYTLPNHPPVNVRRLRELLTDSVNLVRMTVLMPGRSLPFRLISLHNAAWAYSMGHEMHLNMNLGESGLLSVLNSGASLYRLKVYELTSRTTLPEMYVFRPVTQEQMLRTNFEPDLLPYLAQVIDKSTVTVLRPARLKNFLRIMDTFAPRYYPFIEARVMLGPNVETQPEIEVKEFWGVVNSSVGSVDDCKLILSFHQKDGKYEQKHVDRIMETLQKDKELDKARIGVALEVTSMSAGLNFSAVVTRPNVRYIFLTNDYGDLDRKNVHEMKGWMGQFADQIVVLMFNDQHDKVNLVYREFEREEPEDTSAWQEEPQPGEPTMETMATEPTKMTTPSMIIDTYTTLPPEPLAENDTVTNVKSMGARLQQGWMVRVGGLMVVVGMVGTGWQRVL